MTDQSSTASPNQVPAEIDRWNWGAFLLNWIWGIGNNTYVALLTLVPFFGIIMPFVLGAKGSRWAWRNGRWDSIAHFKRVQRAWAKWACILYLCAIAFFGVMLGGTIYWLRHSAAYALAESQLRSSGEAASLLGTPIEIGIPLGFITNSGATGRAVLSFSVSGPKGGGRVFGDAIKKDGLWSLGGLKLKVYGHDGVIDLINQARVDADDASPRRMAFAGAF